MCKHTSIALLAALALSACSSSSSGPGAAAPAVGTAPAAAEAATPAAVADTQLGLAKGSVFDTLAPAAYAPPAAEPGGNRLLPRANAAAPPLVPHEVVEFLPITRDANACVDCHAIAEREPGGPVPLPASHYVDLRNAPGERRETVAGARWVCTSCHVGQTDAPLLVRNAAGT